MRAVRFHGARDIRVDQIEEPVCGEEEVKVCITSFAVAVVLCFSSLDLSG